MSEQVTLQKALYTIKKMKHMLAEQKPQKPQAIAIVGLSARYPTAMGKEAYWQMLMEGRNTISSLPEARWDLLKGTHEYAIRDKEHPYWGSFLTDIDAFDAYFFGISPREAQRIDPQHRLLMEVAYEAFEDAGIPVEKLAGSNTGVFSSLYVSQLAHMQQMDTEMDALYFPTGNAISIAANRLSYLFDLHGPSLIIDSACSSSMAGIQLACLNIQNGLCDTAIVCGAKLNLLPYVNFVLTKAKMLSVDGQCKTFDADANGYVQGEGVGVIVLKPLDKALAEGDRIYGVIEGCAVNQDGKTNGLTAPNGLQQEKLLETAYRNAGIDTHNISYVECHGTGTFLGDPIEIEALGEVIAKDRDKEKPCWIGSVKTNIGHLEPAAGIAGVIKVALSLQHKTIPPHLHFKTPNPHIPFHKYQLAIPTEAQHWPQYGEYRVAGISGFGFGGTNSHIVIRDLAETEKPKTFNEEMLGSAEMFTLSAKDADALHLYIKKWCDFLENATGLDLARICYNLHVRRSHYTCRLALIVHSVDKLYTKLIELAHSSLESVTLSKSCFINLKKEKRTFDVGSSRLQKLGLDYINHSKIDWQAVEKKRQYVHMDLPLYPWQHKKYWPPLINKSASDAVGDNAHPLQGKAVLSPLSHRQFEFVIDSKRMPEMEDTYNVVHAGFYMEIFSFAAREMSGAKAFSIEDHEFLSPLFAQQDLTVTVQFVVEKVEPDAYLYHFYSRVQNQVKWVLHARGLMILRALESTKKFSIDAIKNRSTGPEANEILYAKISAMGMPTGESIRWTKQYWAKSSEILCEFEQPEVTLAKNALYSLGVHPGIVDASIQPVFHMLPTELIKPYIASGVKRMNWYGLSAQHYYLYAHLKQTSEDGTKLTSDCYLLNERSEVLAEFEDVVLTQLDDRAQIQRMMAEKDKHVKVNWQVFNPAEQKTYLTQFLSEHVATIFSIPLADVHLERSLREMGIDSLSAIVLMRTIEEGLGVSYALHDLLEGPSIMDLVAYLLSTVKGAVMDGSVFVVKQDPERWIAYRKPQVNKKIKLFCFPFGGGGASIYREWQALVGSGIEICPVQLAGRENRLNETPVGDIHQLVAELVDHLSPEFNEPYAFFGHSFGSLISFELTRSLRARNMPLPKHLFASAFPDPRVPTKSLNTLLEQLKEMDIDLFSMNSEAAIAKVSDDKLKLLGNVFSENGIVDYGDSLMNKEVLKVLLPIFIGDMGIAKSYQYQDQAPLNVPITVFLGHKDTWVSREDHLKWVDHTNQRCTIREFDSGHLFIKDKFILQEVVSQIQKDLLSEKIIA